MKSKNLIPFTTALSLSLITAPFVVDAVQSDENETNVMNSETEKLQMDIVSRYDSGIKNEDGGTTEIVAYNADNEKMYVINGTTKVIEVISTKGLHTSDLQINDLQAESTIDIEALLKQHNPSFQYGDLTSISINTDKKLIAVSVQAKSYNDDGLAVLLNYEGQFVQSFSTGKQPDMITFSPDGNKMVIANEGEPREGYGDHVVDPMGSVTIVNLSSNIDKSSSTNITFETFDSKRNQLIEDNVIVKKDTAPSVDLEPEYIAVSSDSKNAYITLQENNAIANLNLETGEFEYIKGLGFKDHSLVDNSLDLIKDNAINITTQDVYGMYMPDGISYYENNGNKYLITANEGDSREWGDYLNEVEMKIDGENVVTINTADYDGLDENKTYIFGGRSFSIYNADTMEQVFDSGSDFETITAERLPEFFNSSNTNIKLDNRSGKKGPEPEDVKIGTVGDKTYAFIALERIGGIMMYDITDPAHSQFVDYVNTRDFSMDISGDVSPEGLYFVSENQNSSGMPLLLAAHEVSGTVAAYAISTNTIDIDNSFVDTKGHWAEDAIHYAKKQKILLGINDTHFNPNGPLSRAMFVTALSRIENEKTTVSSGFTDVPSNAYYTNAVSWAFENGITQGYLNNQFKPNISITREQLAVMAYNYAKYANISLDTTNPSVAFKDEHSISSWATNAVKTLSQAGIMKGKANQKFDPKTTVTRAEAATVIHRLLTL